MTIRNYNVTPQLPPNGLTVAEFFCGGGLMAVGLKAAGYDITFANDFDKRAAEAYAFNLGDYVVCGDITSDTIQAQIPDADIFAGGPPCFPAGQRIVTDRGSINIEDIRKGDVVLTHTGAYRDVVTTMHHEYRGLMFEIQAKYYRIPVKTTSEHPFWTKRGWVAAKDLTTDDYVGMPISKFAKLPEQFSYTAIINQKKSETRRSALPFHLKSFWKLVGYWVAEGWTRDCRLRSKTKKRRLYEILFAANDTKLAYIRGILDDLGLRYSVSQQRTCKRISFTNHEYWTFIKNFTKGTTASDKLLPEFIQHLPTDMAKAFIEGYFNGDGCTTNGYRQFSSTSLVLLEGFQRLLLKTEKRLYSLTLGNKEGISNIEGRVIRNKNCYYLKTGKTQGSGVEFLDDCVYFKLDKINSEYVESVPVFNFEVEVDNSYCLPMIAVHNCQDYSVAGSGAGEEGERGKLVWTYLDIIARKQPKAFVFENVKNLIGKRHRHTFDALTAKFEEIGYNVSWRLINAWDYGVAQKRERVFIVGIRKDLGITFEFPEPRPEGYRTQVLRDVIGDLPEPAAQSNGQYWAPKREYTYDQANRVQSMDGASNTIPAHHNSGQPIHPTQAPRRFTVRECLRIQSVPDWYVLPDTIKLSPQYRIVGNGVASRVSYLIGIALAEQLNAALAQSLPEAA